MGRQTADIDERKGVRFACNGCGRAEYLKYWPDIAGGTDGGARAKGYRITGPEPDAKVYCPECSGQDEGYWQRKRLNALDNYLEV